MMGVRLFCEGRLDEAEHLHRYAYTARRRLLGDKHPETISSKANIAMTMNEKGQHREAETMYREALLFFESALGRSHPNTLKTYTNLATSLHDQGKYEQASEAVITALPALKLTYGTGHEEFLVALEFHAILLHCLQMHAAALRVAKQVYKQRLRSSGYEHDDTQRVLSHVRDLAEDFEEEQVVNAFPLLIEAITN
ncbi:hypothetical protein GQ44DRAFT_711687 [Phaeosphaeriaceae sp. PMI808]|nr:hypothetical protein GQ44DRAFT_711687 [Phaeosphaeriaceae sp. PMI808]